MSSTNDSKIKQLLEAVAAKKEALGERPKPHWVQNGQVPAFDGSWTNINMITRMEDLLRITSGVILLRNSRKDAAEMLEVPEEEASEIAILEGHLQDLQLKAKIIRWELKKKKLSSMEQKLLELRSEDARTADALDSIEDLLK